MAILISILAVLAMLACLSWTFGLIVVGVALIAEVSEFTILKRVGSAYGGSRKAFWGAVISGLPGLFFGIRVPVIGPMITAFLT